MHQATGWHQPNLMMENATTVLISVAMFTCAEVNHAELRSVVRYNASNLMA